MFENDVLCTTNKKRHNRTDTNGIENNMSEIEDPGLLKTGIGTVPIKTGIRLIRQRYCLKCGKILPTELKRNYVHNCEKPDFLL